MKRSQRPKLINRSLAFLVALLFLGLGCNAQNKKKVSLADIYAKYKTDHSVKSMNEFFYIFPHSFAEFQKLYGYNEVKGASPYYTVASEHVALLYKASLSIEKKAFSAKLFEISKNGKWDADAVNYFQEGLRNYFFKESKEIIDLLNKKSNNEIESFWYFYSDGPHFNEPIHTKTLAMLKGNPILIDCYERAVKRAKKDNVH